MVSSHGAMFRKDPAEAAAWVDQYLGTDKINGEVISDVSREWAEEDPQAAISWVGKVENEGDQSRGYAAAIDRWAREDPAGAGDWLAGLRSRRRTTAPGRSTGSSKRLAHRLFGGH